LVTSILTKLNMANPCTLILTWTKIFRSDGGGYEQST